MNAVKRGQSGYTLIEVLVGIAIFAVGMLALAQLQGHLSKSSADAIARTVAVNIAEEEIERMRSFGQVPASSTVAAFDNIVTPSAPKTVTRGNLAYTVETAVTDLYYNPATEGFQATKPNPDMIYPDLKRVELTVSWAPADDAPRFRVDATQDAVDLGTGSVTLVDLISSFTTTSGAKVRLNSAAEGLYAPPVTYNPGQNPDIVSIRLGANKFKESTTPLPDVLRTDELVETRFDVVTYSQDDQGATFLRREEFRVVSCECTLRLPGGSAADGRRPTIWNGYDYSEGEFAGKPWGESASNQQSTFCDLCCRDHHDGGTATLDDANDPGRALYNPFRAAGDYHASGSLAGDHKHFHRDRLGNMVLAEQDGDPYVEACRLVRKDGFFRIAQDLRQEGLNAFPANYLDDDSEVADYSAYVTGAVSGYELAMGETAQYETSPPLLGRPSDRGLLVPASTPFNPSIMSASGLTEQQLRSRGVYIDYMSDELRCRINYLDNGAGDCQPPPNVTTALEIIPFYDVQLTWLSRWTETPSNDPIDVTNETILDDNAHSRGLATLESGPGTSVVNSAVHGGNLGLTGTDPIDGNFASEVKDYNLYAKASDTTAPPVLTGIRITGDIVSAVPGVKAADVEITPSGAQCDRTLTGFECAIIDGAKSPTLRVDNYFKLNRALYACSEGLGLSAREHSTDNPSGNYAIFRLPVDASISGVLIVIREDGCLASE